MEYELTAMLKRPTRGVLFPSKDLEATLDVVVKSWNNPPYFFRGSVIVSPDSTQMVKIDQHFAASQFHGSKMSLLDRAIMNIFKPSDLRGITVTITVLLDRNFRPSGLCPLLLRVAKGASSNSAEESPISPIKLRSYTLRLIARTALRAKLEAFMVQDVNHHAVDGRVLLSGKGLDLDIPWGKNEGPLTSPLVAERGYSLEGWLNLSSKRPADKPDRGFMTPTFKTYNINREYALTLEMKLEFEGIKYDVKRDNIDVAILPEDDYVATRQELDVIRDRRLAEQDGRPEPQSDSKPVPLSTDEKKGYVAPPSREPEQDQLPQYEPGDVPVYQAGEDPS